MRSRQVGLVDGGGSGPWCVRCAAARSHRIGDDGDRGGARRLHAVNARRTKIKALYGHRNGFCLWYKRLERERFAWPQREAGATLAVSMRELEWLLEGFDLWRGGPHETLHFESVTHNRSQTFMLDTDTCIFLMRGESPALAVKVQSVPLQQQVMSAVTFAELTYGVQASATARRKHNQAVLDGLALHLAVLDWPQEAARHYAEIRVDLKRRGAQLGAADLMIAAHARAMGATAVTSNVKDFGRVKGLKVENWTARR